VCCGFTEDANAFCTTHGIGVAEKMVYLEPELLQEG
jgi:hypothetical protein